MRLFFEGWVVRIKTVVRVGEKIINVLVKVKGHGTENICFHSSGLRKWEEKAANMRK